MAGEFDDLLPKKVVSAKSGAFDDLVPQAQPVKGAFADLVPAQPTVSSYEPSMFERITDALGLGGANRDRASNELAARNIAKRDGLSVDQVYRDAGGNRPIFNPEGRGIGQVVPQTLDVLQAEVPRILPGVANSALRAIRGGNVPLNDTGIIDRGIAATERPKAEYVDPNYESLTGIGDSLGYSVATTVPAIIAGAGGTAAAGPVAGVGAGMAASGGVAYRASKDQFLNSLRDKMNADSMLANGRPLNEAEWAQASADAEAEAVKYGAYEAIPEAVSNALMLKAFKPLARGVTKPIGTRAGEQAAALGAEQGTETITALGQNEAERAVGLTKEELDVVSAFRKQFLQTLIVSGGTGGGIYAGGKVKDLARDFYQKNVEPRVAPNSALERAFNEEIAKFEADPNAARREAMKAFDPNGQAGVDAGTTIQTGAFDDLIPKQAAAPEPVETPVAAAPVETPAPVATVTETPAPVEAPVAAEPEERPANRRTVSTASGTKVDTDFEVVSLSDLKQAEGELQNRDRTRATSDDQIREIVGGFDPTRLGESAETDRGAPIVGPDNVIESGNGRTRAIEQVYASDETKAKAYKDFIRSLGYDPDSVDRPVLIRRRKTEFTPEQRRQFVIDSNTESTMRLNATEQAKTDADLIDEKTLANYQGGDLTNAGNAGFVRAFIERLPAASRAELIGPNNQISQTGVRRIENALMGRAYGSQELLSKLLEDRDNNIRSVGGAMLDVAGPFAALRQAVKDGKVKKEFDITDNLVEAARILSGLRDKGTGIREYLDQIDAFNPIDAVTERVLKSFANSKLTKAAGRDKIAAFLKDYVEQAQNQTTDDTLFDMEPVTPQAILDGALNRKNEGENVPTSGGLFDANKTAPKTEGANNDTVADAVEETDEADRSEGVDAGNEGVDEVRRKANKKKSKKTGEFNAQNRILGESLYGDAWQAAEQLGVLSKGQSPNLLPSPRQIAILRDVFKQVFGFKTVLVDNNLNDREAIDALLDGYASIQSMMAVSGMPASAISLNGTLRLDMKRAFGGALAYYSPSDRSIGMVRRNDSFAHEWGHALDWHMALELGMTVEGDFAGRGLSGKIKGGAVSKNPAIQLAFANLNDAMFGKNVDAAGKIYELEKKIEVALNQIEKLSKGELTNNKKAQIEAARKRIEKFANQIAEIKKLPKAEYKANTDYYLEARMLDKQGATEAADGGYWQRPTEMLARSFEAFMAMKLALNNYANEFATATDEQYQGGGIASEQQANFFAKAYPQGAEREAIFQSWQAVMDTVRDQNIMGPIGNLANTDAVPVPKADILAVNRAEKWAPTEKPATLNPIKALIRNIQETAAERKREEARALDASKLVVRTQLAGPGGKVRGKMYDLAHAGMAGWGFTVRGMILGLQKKYPNSSGLKFLEKNFATDPGSGKLQGAKYEESVTQRLRQVTNRFANIVSKHGIEQYGDDELRELRDLLVDETGKMKASAALSAAASDIRTLMNDEWTYLTQNGVDVGYTKNGYLPRIIDEMKLALDPEQFRKKAAEVYTEVFERDYGTVEAILDDEAKFDDFMQQASDLIRKDDPLREKVDKVRKLRSDITRLEGQLETADDPDLIQSKIDEMTNDMAELVDELYPTVQERFAEGAANDWYERAAGLAKEPYFALETRGAAGSFTKSRILPEVTDRIMGDFMVTDPVELISTYLAQSTRRVQYGKFFGNPEKDKGLGWKLDDAFNAMVREGVMPADLDELRVSVDLMTSRYKTNMTKRGLRFRSTLTALYTPVLLARAMWSQLAEPATIFIRSGNLADIPRAYGAQLQDLLAKLDMGKKSWREQVAWRREMSEFLGTTSHYLFDEIMSNRDNLIFQSKASERRLAKFYRYSFIHPHAMSMRRAAVSAAFRHIGTLAQRAGTDDMARVALKEMGLNPKNEGLIEFLSKMDSKPSTADLAGSNYFKEVSTAVNRFVDESIMDPKRIDKPRLASTPEWSYMYGILSFAAAFQRNVVIRSGKQIETAAREGGKTEAAKTAAMVAVGFGALAALQTAAYLLRTAAFGDLDKELDKWRDDPMYAASTIVSRSGFTGLFDPLLNVFQGVKYQRDMTAMTAGALPSFVLGASQKLVEAQFRNSPKTNTAEYNAIGGFWDLVVAPAIAYAVLSRAPILTPFLQFTSSKATKDAAATAIVGPKDDKKGGKKDEGI